MIAIMAGRFKWQQNLRSIPPGILRAVASFGKKDCLVACVSKITETQLKHGDFSHVSIKWGEDGPEYEPKVLPRPAVGRYSRRNVLGYELIHRDEPKHTKTWSVYSPNFGDWSRGGHDVPVEREVYPREEFPPKFLSISVECLGKDLRSGAYIFKFAVEEVLDRTKPGFERDLLFDLNLLQENIGNHNVHESGSTSEDYLKTLFVNWEILPPGEREDNVARILTGVNTSDPRVRAQLLERYDFLQRLQPRDFIKGVSGFQRYFGARFADDLVVFENVEYGNAAYVMFEDWQHLSRMSRTELVSLRSEGFVRIPHTKTWKVRVRHEIGNRLKRGR